MSSPKVEGEHHLAPVGSVGDCSGRRSAYCAPERPWNVCHGAASITTIGGRTGYFRFTANQNATGVGGLLLPLRITTG
jgi:hypothetical protein